MKSFISGGQILVLLVMLGIILAIPIAAQTVASDMLPERWRFESWPLGLQIPFAVVCVLYFIADIWFTVRWSRKDKRR
jgi:hypothetical protein